MPGHVLYYDKRVFLTLSYAVNPICLWTCSSCFFPSKPLCHAAFVLKAGAKVQLLFYPASFFKKNFFSFSKPTNPKSQASSYFHPFRFGRAKIKSFPLIKQVFLKLFFRLSLFLIIRRRNAFMLSKYVSRLRAAKVEKFLSLPNLFSSFFLFPFSRNPFIHKG